MARAAMLDGPLGLANAGETLRACERQSAAAGKTPDKRPGLDKPFGGFIRSSLDIFAALKESGVIVNPPEFLCGVSEVYPAHIWRVLANGWPLPKKTSREGRLARKQILEGLRVSDLPDLPTHDQNDACVSAVLAAAADAAVPGVALKHLGSPMVVDAGGTLREGCMVVPEVGDEARGLIARVLLKAPPVS